MKFWQRLNIFESATLRLTAWYMVIVMVLSLTFSAVLYTAATSEFRRALGPFRPGEVNIFIDGEYVQTVREQRIQDSNGRVFLSLAWFNAVVLLGGTALSYFMAKRTLRPIRESHEAQVQFTSDAAHELRTPLAVMQTEIEVGLRDKKATMKDLEEILVSNLEEVTRLRTLTDRLLMLASSQKIELGDVDIEAASSEAMTRFIKLAEGKKISIDNQVKSMKVAAHYESFVEILGILLDNAIKYSPVKSNIVLSSKRLGNEVYISVADEGIGVPDAEREKIFERFYRSDSSRSKENVEGHGLGLSLAQRLAGEMRGRVEVSRNQPKGSIFTLVLPVRV